MDHSSLNYVIGPMLCNMFFLLILGDLPRYIVALKLCWEVHILLSERIQIAEFDYQSVTTLQKGKQVKTNKENLTDLFCFFFVARLVILFDQKEGENHENEKHSYRFILRTSVYHYVQDCAPLKFITFYPPRLQNVIVQRDFRPAENQTIIKHLT